MANAFYPLYTSFVTAANSSLNTSSYSPNTATQSGRQMLALLTDLDAVLHASGQPQFSLAAWIAKARAWASPTTDPPLTATNSSSSAQTASFYEYNARNQITLWGPTGTPRYCCCLDQPLTTLPSSRPNHRLRFQTVGWPYQLLLHPKMAALYRVHTQQQHISHRCQCRTELELASVRGGVAIADLGRGIGRELCAAGSGRATAGDCKSSKGVAECVRLN